MKSIKFIILFSFFIFFSKYNGQNASYKTNGAASNSNITGPNGLVDCNCFKLTSSSQGQVGSVWNENKIDLNQNIRIEFDVYLGSNNGGADGMVFGLQKTNTSIGSSGGGMGMQGVNPSLGVYFDTYQNLVAPDNHNDPVSDHISIQKNGDLDHSTANNLAGPVNLANIEDNQWRRFIFDWNSTTKTLKVYLVDVVNPVLTYSGDIVNTIFSGDSFVYWGFTGSTGYFHNLQKFCTVSDLEAPDINCPNDFVINNDPGSCGAILNYFEPVGSDNCGSVTVSQLVGIGTGGFFPVGTTLNTFEAIDLASNNATCSFNVTVNDVSTPNIICPPDQTDSYDAACSFTIIDYINLVSISDDCDPNPIVSQNPPIGTLILNDTVITITATDASGNQSNCQFNLTLNDTTSPSINCPLDQTDIYTSNCDFTLLDYTGLATSSDNCDPSPVISQSPLPGTLVTSNTLITLTSTDISGNFSTCTFNLILNDSTAPSITCPPNQINFYSPSCDFNLIDYTNLAISTDNCDPSPTITQFPIIGSIIYSDTVILLTATDAAGNSSSCSFTLSLSDTISPIINCPVHQIDYYDSSCEFTLLDYTLLGASSDNCDQNLTITQTPLPGEIITTDTTITLFVQDNSGNNSSCTFNLSLLDSISPLFNCLSNQIGYLDSSCLYNIPNYMDSILFMDNCDTSLTINQVPPNGILISQDTVIEIIATDATGNSSSCNFNLFLFDTISPNILCPNDTILNNDSSLCGALCSYVEPVGIDNCTPLTQKISGLSSGSVFPRGLNTIIYEVSDSAGNIETCDFYVLVNDIEFPQISCPEDTTAYLDENCEVEIIDYQSWINVSDNCGIQSLTQSPTIGQIFTDNYSVSFFAVDSTGNVSTCSFNINLLDVNPPSVVCPTDKTRDLDQNCILVLPDYSNELLISDLCSSIESIVQIPSADTVLNIIGQQAITYFITDSSGNVETCSFNLFIENNDINNCSKIFIPSIFSPDNDGINDLFVIKGLDLEGYVIEIYSRWGEMVYKNQLDNGSWDGTYQSKLLPSGTYVYKITDLDYNIKHKGTVTLIR